MMNIHRIQLQKWWHLPKCRDLKIITKIIRNHLKFRNNQRKFKRKKEIMIDIKETNIVQSKIALDIQMQNHKIHSEAYYVVMNIQFQNIGTHAPIPSQRNIAKEENCSAVVSGSWSEDTKDYQGRGDVTPVLERLQVGLELMPCKCYSSVQFEIDRHLGIFSAMIINYLITD